MEAPHKVVQKSIAHFDMEQIANSGQCFRIRSVASDVWEVPAFGRRLVVRRTSEGAWEFDCNECEFQEIWSNYFDLQTDYGAVKNAITSSGDEYLRNAVRYGWGIRILRQDPWEMTVSFIISQQNNIPRIRSTIARLCEPFGGAFPSPAELAGYTEANFVALGLGYRAKYVVDVVRAVLDGRLDFHKLTAMSTPDAIATLRQFNGIGVKVASCIALFGLHKIDAFPIDVWIKKIIDERYGGTFPLDHFAGYAGIVQQYMYFYQRALEKRMVPVR